MRLHHNSPGGPDHPRGDEAATPFVAIGAAAAEALPDGPFTVGVEEELGLVDARTLELCGSSDDVLAALPPRLREFVGHELQSSQIETATPVCESLDDLRSHLVDLRGSLAEAAAACGCAVLTSGTHPVSAWADQALTPEPSYRALQRDYQRLTDEQIVFGCHVHVGVEDRDLRIAALDRVRPWLAPLLALTGNSPWWEGSDTGFDSYRYVVFSRWPTFATPGDLGDWAGYRAVLDTLVESGAIDGPKRLYWTVRPSEAYPTLEFRITDVCTTVEEAVMVAGLARALVATAVAEAVDGRPVPELRGENLSMAEWQAARHGLRGELLDPVSGRSRPGVDAVAELLDHVGPALDALDGSADVRAAVDRIVRHGNGAERQRAALAEVGLPAALTALRLRPTGEARPQPAPAA